MGHTTFYWFFIYCAPPFSPNRLSLLSHPFIYHWRHFQPSPTTFLPKPFQKTIYIYIYTNFHSPFHFYVDVTFFSILYFGRSNFFFYFVFFSPCVTSAPIPFFHRCAPVNISCYAKFAEALITFVSDNSVLHRLISGVMTSKEIIIGLCFLSLGNGFSNS